MNDRWWYKEIVSNALLVDGKAVPFEQLDGNRGVIALDSNAPQHKGLIAGLDAAAAAGKGGVVKISAEEYEEKKSLYPFSPSRQPQTEMLRLVPGNKNPFARDQVVPGAATSHPATLEAQMEAQNRILSQAKVDHGILGGEEQQAIATPTFKPATGRVGPRVKAA